MIKIIEYSNALFDELNLPEDFSVGNSGWFTSKENDLSYFKENNFVEKENEKIWVATYNDEVQGFLIFRSANWDTEFFGYESGRLDEFSVWSTIPEVKNKIITELFSVFLKHAKELKLKFCLASINVWDIDISEVLSKNGFNFIVNWGSCYLKKKNDYSLPDNYSIREASIDDSEKLLDITQYYFKGGRFYLDPNIDNKKVDSLYENLVINSIKDKAAYVKILKTENQDVVGFFIYKKVDNNSIKIGALRFLVFDPNYTAGGLANSFLSEVSNTLLEDCDIVTSGIELHNVPSLAIHLKSRFKFNHSRNAFHGWFNF